jgi:hypothetical protein
MKREEKKKYEKPVLRIIELAAEETMTIGCKTLSGLATRSNPAGCVGLQHCSGKGS